MFLSYDLTTFQILGQIWKFVKSFVCILVQTLTPKGHFEINCPLKTPVEEDYYLTRSFISLKRLKHFLSWLLAHIAWHPKKVSWEQYHLNENLVQPDNKERD